MQVDPLADPEIQQKTVKEYLEEIKDTMVRRLHLKTNHHVWWSSCGLVEN
eukprot:m.137062 g.137062  ORF g.137062 m.137062 type:complete len:50 (+) comp15884_c0_seq1:316-465(+)